MIKFFLLWIVLFCIGFCNGFWWVDEVWLFELVSEWFDDLDWWIVVVFWFEKKDVVGIEDMILVKDSWIYCWIVIDVESWCNILKYMWYVYF